MAGLAAAIDSESGQGQQIPASFTKYSQHRRSSSPAFDRRHSFCSTRKVRRAPNQMVDPQLLVITPGRAPTPSTPPLHGTDIFLNGDGMIHMVRIAGGHADLKARLNG